MGGIDKQKGVAFAIAAASAYALVPNFVRSAYQSGVPALEAVCVRTAVVAVVLLIFARLNGASMYVSRQAMPGFALMFLATFAVSACYLSSVQFVSVGVAVTLFYTFPVIIALASPLLERRKPSGLLLALVALAFFGLVLAIGPAFSGLDWRGIALAIASAFGCALQFFSGRMLAKHMQPAAFGSLIHILLLPVVVVMALYFGQGQIKLAQLPALSWPVIMVFAMALAYCAGYFLHMSAVNKAPADVVAPYFNLEPVLSTMIAIVFLAEETGVVQLAGIALVVAALIAVNRVEARRAEP